MTVTRREVRGYYVRNGDRYRRREARRVRHILCPDVATAQDAIRRLDAGADMAALAEAVSIDVGTRTRGGELGDVHRGELSGPLEDAIFSAPVGTVFGPIQTEHGWHVARVDAVSAASCVPYAEARPAIEADLLAAERSRVFGAWLEASARGAGGHRARVRAPGRSGPRASRATGTDRRDGDDQDRGDRRERQGGPRRGA